MSSRKVRNAAYKSRATEIGTHVAKLSNRVISTTFPIYQASNLGCPDACGSGVLLALGEARFVLTATHVFRTEWQRELRIATGQELLSLKGERVRLFREGAVQPKADDDIDITVVRMNNSVWQALPLESYVQWVDIDHSAIRLTRDSFLLAGYPAKKQGAVRGNEIAASVYQALCMESLPIAYKAEGRDPNTSIVLGFNERNWGTEGLETAPYMEGMSGSGMWRLGPKVLAATTDPKLSGIMVECIRKGKHPHVFGTRMRPVLEALVAKYSDVRAFVEARLAGNT